MLDPDTLRIVSDADAWLDSHVGPLYTQQPLAQHWARIGKLNEEAGEAVQALIGWTAQNPRKGFTHDIDDVLAELGDVVLTGILAIQHFTKDTFITNATLRTAVAKLKNRIPKDA